MSIVKGSKYYAVRTTAGREIDVALIVETRVKEHNRRLREKKDVEETLIEEKPIEIKAIVVPPGTKGYVYFETANLSSIYRAIQDIKYVKRGSPIKVEKEELLRLIKPKPVIELINVGDLVEISKGPFRGMKAQILSIDRNKNVVMLSILEAQVNVPITVPADYVKPLKKSSSGV